MKRIKELRIKRGLTLKQVADRLGVSEGTVQRYESGAINNLKYDTIVALANIFRCTPSYLMGFDDGEPLDIYQEKLNQITSELNEEGQEKVLEYAKLLVASGEYKKRDSVAVGEK